ADCYAKRTLEIFDRLNIGQAVVDRGVSWQVGRTFFQDREVYRFNLLAEAGHERPAMINLQQYHLEAILQQRAASAQVALRWRQRVVDLTPQADAVRLRVESPDG
ncbi:MAG: FAD-dependent oxidoreductase, partial [Betaproteobacteria bacterium]|nr:FAD-dependent oxidoreductase [Betaproteobacteria bacterium]